MALLLLFCASLRYSTLVCGSRFCSYQYVATECKWLDGYRPRPSMSQVITTLMI